jgi:poly-D-alanine transfer protein DltD
VADTKAKTINGLVFEISQPYAAGHVVTEAEARVLNQTRSENIGNNVRAKLKEMADAGSDHAALAALVAERDAEYEFTLSNVGESRKLDPYEKEAEKIARELLKNHLAETGRKLTTAPEGVTEDEWKAKIAAEVDRISVSDNVVKAARQRVDARKKQAESLAESLAGTEL